MNPATIEKHEVITELTNEYIRLEEKYKKETSEINDLERTIKFLREDKAYLEKIIKHLENENPTLKMRMIARGDVLLSYCGLKRIKGGQC